MLVKEEKGLQGPSAENSLRPLSPILSSGGKIENAFVALIARYPTQWKVERERRRRRKGQALFTSDKADNGVGRVEIGNEL